MFRRFRLTSAGYLRIQWGKFSPEEPRGSWGVITGSMIMPYIANTPYARQDHYPSHFPDRSQANGALMTKLMGVEDRLIQMDESYEGQVQHVGENTAVVLYNVDGELVEQTYERKQFKDGRLPRVGACVKVVVFLIEYEPKPPSADEVERATSDKPSHRKPLTGPVEF